MEHVRVDAVVVGSGFGGAAAAARLAQAGLSVVVLERGRRWKPGDFPRDVGKLEDDWLWGKDQGLYDIRWLDRMASVQAAGWGGGSLVYANVFARPPREVFDSWPDGYDRDALDPYYDVAAHMLRVRPVGTDPLTGQVPARTVAMEGAASRLHRPAGTVRPLLAVTFADHPGPPRAGECTFVGECMFGCNEGAKNSVDRNYLSIAEEHGAEARTLCEVDRIAPSALGYEVGYLDRAAGRRGLVQARAVFLAAGAVGTTELLLRNRDVLRTLPDLSPALGRGFSGNGDFLAFVSRPRSELSPQRGPTITTTTIVDCHIGKEKVWFQVQDGAYPAQLSELVRSLNPLRRPARARNPRARRRPEGSRSRGTMALLMMGRDTADGVLTLDHNGEARVAWRNRPNAPLYRAEMRAARQAARQLGGRVRFLPSWVFLRTGVTVHNLGGAPMGDDPCSSVIDRSGQVHGYPRLYVVDGAGIPASTGVNPSATITAVAERRVEAAIRELTGDETWRAPERAHAARAAVPEDEAMLAVQQWRHVHRHSYDPSPRPVVFREVLSGEVELVESGSTSARALRLRLAVELPDSGVPVGEPAPVASVTGVLDLGDARAEVRGDLTLFPRARGDGLYMRYDLSYTDGRRCHGRITGTKAATRGRRSLLRDLTTLSVSIEHSEGGASATGTGAVRISLPGVVALACSVRGGGRDHLAAAMAVARFGSYFVLTALRRARSFEDRGPKRQRSRCPCSGCAGSARSCGRAHGPA
ncbi:GMC family oxidoreductase [Microbacterium album]|uniref:Cholesterol oxidase n=1 Tax=Microbacterium album TaxID=2053191 RepID=A0A917IH31_9MICO|nr:GMC family oxidoreductase [Microbacterium album]GGH45863.1 hypothetical protein GCM10010921_21530 [Microbacterium album]